jgi:hypothetical protein
MKKILALIAVMVISGCSLSSADRQAITDTGLKAAAVALDALEAVGVDPVNASPEVLTWANAACGLMEAGSPILVVVINKVVEARSTETAPVTVEEFVRALEGICTIIRALLEPEPPTVAPIVSPIPLNKPEIPV